MREGLLGDRVGCRKCLLGGGGGASSWRRREVRPGCGSASFPADFPTPLPTRVWSRLLLPLDLQPIGWAEAQPLGSSAGAPVPWRAVSPRVASRLLVLNQRHCLPARPSFGALAPEFLGLVYLRVLVSGARFSVTADQVFTGPYQPRVAKVPPPQGKVGLFGLGSPSSTMCTLCLKSRIAQTRTLRPRCTRPSLVAWG